MRPSNNLFSALLCALLLSYSSLSAQSEAYTQAMTERVASLAQMPPQQMLDYADEFERFATLPGSDWLASYWAAYCVIMPALADPNQADALTARAESLLEVCTMAGGDASEIACLRSLIATARLIVSPAERWQTYGAESSRQLDLAAEADPTNPRIYYLRGQSLLFTPENFGGGRARALPLLERCLELEAQRAPLSPYAPSWGAQQARALIERNSTK